jgi:S1-C subfamily serine protease
MYSTSEVAQDGLHGGIIRITDRNFDHGNSGGPVFTFDGTKFIVIGIVSAGVGSSVGYIVPVCNTP